MTENHFPAFLIKRPALFTGYVATANPRLLTGAALLYGAGLVEFPTLYVLAPLATAATLIVLHQQKRLTRITVMRLAGYALSGSMLYIPAALQYLGHPSLAWREINGTGAMFVELWREQYVAIKYSLPKVGWLTTGLLTLFPAAIALIYRVKSAYQHKIRTPRLILIMFIFAPLAAVAWNFPLAPWMMTKGNPLLVTPYLMASLACGLLMAHVLSAGKTVWSTNKTLLYVALPAGLSLAAGALRTYPMIRTEGEAAIARFSQETLKSLDGRTWLVTSGELDANRQLEAKRSNIPLRLLNPALARSGPYRASCDSQLADARLAGLLSTVRRRDTQSTTAPAALRGGGQSFLHQVIEPEEMEPV
jgi:hypothetical protein